MAEEFANIIIDISHEKVDRTFQYRIPDALKGRIRVGELVNIPFGAGNRLRKGYVVELTDTAEYDSSRIKEIAGIETKGVSAKAQLIELAWWMKERYGSTMNQALKTVLPVKEKIRQEERKIIRTNLTKEELENRRLEAERKHYKARERLFSALVDMGKVPYELATGHLNLTASTLKPLIDRGDIYVERLAVYRNPVTEYEICGKEVELNEEQKKAADCFTEDYRRGKRETYLLHGITGSGKTEVYMEMMEQVLQEGKQVIVLIPEISLTYQTVMRFYKRFGNQVSVINSRLSKGERYDQFERAEKGEIQIMIGPRSALFTPFSRLGLIIIDEEQEAAYKSEITPRYHAREVAAKRAHMAEASLVLGSATPSLESYEKALTGEYRLLTLSGRAKKDSVLADTEIVDLREELKSGNRSIFSRRLQELIEERLNRREQTILFINRRGYANFMSCRSCGKALKCPHCDVSLTLHRNGNLKCHYCGFEMRVPQSCPSCRSPYIAGFGTGTQKIEEITKKMYPMARVLRMDMDTTSKKGGHEEILSAFSRGEADILIGTQMIVKGHDFPNVTLVGIVAADLSLHAPDFTCGERTFQLLTQAAGRAGRGKRPGHVVIQTYMPDHYSIQYAAEQNYEKFYETEMAYRKMLHFPPYRKMLMVQLSSPEEEKLSRAGDRLRSETEPFGTQEKELEIIGPVEASIYKVNDIYRKILYIKHGNYDILLKIRKHLEKLDLPVQLQYDLQ